MGEGQVVRGLGHDLVDERRHGEAARPQDDPVLLGQRRGVERDEDGLLRPGFTGGPDGVQAVPVEGEAREDGGRDARLTGELAVRCAAPHLGFGVHGVGRVERVVIRDDAPDDLFVDPVGGGGPVGLRPTQDMGAVPGRVAVRDEPRVGPWRNGASAGAGSRPW